LDPGETALDIGANIGQMTSLMSRVSGPLGQVHAFEPHPDLFRELQSNADLWRKPGTMAPIACHPSAASDRVGEAELVLHDLWQSNRGLGSLAASASNSASRRLRVQVTSLDSLLGDIESIGVCKIDVEGHELQVLKGATRLLSEGRIRDIVFEDFHPAPSPVQSLLDDYGYTRFSLASAVTRPLLGRPRIGATAPLRDGANFLATRAPERAEVRFAPWGWRVLRR
jgi:FkbM family methyltransferase